MRFADRNVEEKLINSAKKEFLDKGFKKASIRRICSNAEVTTGALYFFFESKEDLFCRIVEKTAWSLKKLANQLFTSEFDDLDIGADNDVLMIKFFWENKTEIQLLLESAEGTRFESYKNDYLKILEGYFLLFFKRYGNENVDRALVKIIVQMRTQGFMKLIKGNYDMNHTIKLARQIGIYADGGFRSLMKAINESNKLV